MPEKRRKRKGKKEETRKDHDQPAKSEKPSAGYQDPEEFMNYLGQSKDDVADVTQVADVTAVTTTTTTTTTTATTTPQPTPSGYQDPAEFVDFMGHTSASGAAGAGGGAGAGASQGTGIAYRRWEASPTPAAAATKPAVEHSPTTIAKPSFGADYAVRTGTAAWRDDVYFSAYAPRAMERGRTSYLSIWAFLREEVQQQLCVCVCVLPQCVWLLTATHTMSSGTSCPRSSAGAR